MKSGRKRLAVGIGQAGAVAAVVALAIGAGVLTGDAADDVAATAALYEPLRAGDPLPQGYRSLLGRDQIRPVYDPVFTSSTNVDWPADSLVIGVAGGDLAKAYPVAHLNRREMVIDFLGDTPILVSW